MRRSPEYVYSEQPKSIRSLIISVAERAHVHEQTGRNRVNTQSPDPENVRCDLTRWQWLAICAHYEYRCAYCGNRPNGENAFCYLTPDHVIPLSRGGDHAADNIVPCCTRCNTWKGRMMLLEWIWYREGLLSRETWKRLVAA